MYIENIRNFVVYCFKGVFFFIVQLKYVLSVSHRPVGHSRMVRNRAITQASKEFCLQPFFARDSVSLLLA